MEKIKRAGFKALREDKWGIERELLLKERKVYVLKDKKLKLEIIQLHNNILVIRYRNKQKTTELVMRNCQWLEVTKDIRKYIKKCDLYQRMKNRTEV